ncbi:DUF4145 domain-containing protein [Agrobacterium tumefaciens]|uniref:DUF4145 domain-containing protein n=1 Tax=Agrobacterium tumefaciens TaxID=358 RepID=UPI002242B849|nr:DUF4145 domain-containing protein [Agrobacterium tumefaciens]MCW8057470.1 DUF4145 domain-containing protein [Agrobacterium tumefaciens]MCW8142587.1 DUF4145 domain-containing protein [Agrobacterium tumefaciens]
MAQKQFTCPHCLRDQVATDSNCIETFGRLNFGRCSDGLVGVKVVAVRCLNIDCNQTTLAVDYSKAEHGVNGWVQGEVLQTWRLRPESSSVVQPDYIPAALREDYYEACLIRDKSPKAAATLARRCLQGMIRDFCDISKSRLIDEIRELKRLVEDGDGPKGVELETIEAIDAVRDIGNIGAHMERDISVIVEVDAGEAQALIELIEMLFQDWYVARHKRGQRLANVKLIAEQKKEELATAKGKTSEEAHS